MSRSDRPFSNRRRDFIRTIAGLPLIGAVPFLGRESFNRDNADNSLQELSGKLPEGKIGDLSISRMIIGCNQISGFAHARDLKYANTLFKAYNTGPKVVETLYLAEKAGITTAFMTNNNYPVFNKYLKQENGRMKSICQTYLRQEPLLSDIDKAIENGADSLYIQGGEGDRYVRDGKISVLAQAIEHIKKRGYTAGMGAHSLEVVKACEKEGLPVDYYVKTFHHDRYWSAHPRAQRVEWSVDAQRSEDHDKIHDNIFDLFPDQTMEYMKGLKKPWIAFKVLAGGAILPKDGFRFAFDNGADFICVGMFDFQVVDNVNTAIRILAEPGKRERAWYA